MPHKFAPRTDRSDHWAAGNHVGITGGPMTDLGGHYSRTRLYLFNRVHIEIGKGGASHLRIRGVRTVEREHCRGSPLSVDRELLGEIRGSVRVRHCAGG